MLQDPYEEDDWQWVVDFLKNNPGLEAKALFKALQHEEPGKYQDCQFWRLQHRVPEWRKIMVRQLVCACIDGNGKEC